jgi:hypothetical protein
LSQETSHSSAKETAPPKRVHSAMNVQILILWSIDGFQIFLVINFQA